MTAFTDFLADLRMDVEECPDPVGISAVRRACIRFAEESDFIRHAHPTIKLAPNTHTYTLTAPAGQAITNILYGRFDGKPVTNRTAEELDAKRGSSKWRDDTGDKVKHITREGWGTTWKVRITPYPTTEDASGAITAATQANPVQITSAAHGRATGDRVYITGVVGMTELNDADYVITVVDVDNFTLDGVDGTGFSAYTSGGTWAFNDGELDVVLALKPARTGTSVDDEVYDQFYDTILSGAKSILYGQPKKKWTNLKASVLEERRFKNGIRDARIRRKEGDMDRSEGLVLRPVKYLPKRAGAPRRTSDFNTEDFRD